MSMTFPADAESGATPRHYTNFTQAIIKARYRTSVGDSNAANKAPLIVQGAPSQSTNLIEVYNSSRAGLFCVDQNGNVVQGGVTSVVNSVVQVALTAAQLTTLDSVPVSLVAAPGANVVLVADAMLFQFKYGTVQFTGGGAVNPVYHGATANLLAGSVPSATIKAAASSTTSLGGPATALALSTNTGLDLYSATADFAAGDSTAIVTLWYTALTLG